MGYIAILRNLCYNYDISQNGGAKFMVCTFFGHKDCYGLKTETLLNAIEGLVEKDVDTFYVGHQGNFDSMVHSCLKQLKEKYPHISYSIVLAYLPTNTQGYDPYQGCSVFPEGLETVHPKFAIEKRNKWLIDHAAYCICCINHTWGGAYKFARQAKSRGLTTINLGSAELYN